MKPSPLLPTPSARLLPQPCHPDSSLASCLSSACRYFQHPAPLRNLPQAKPWESHLCSWLASLASLQGQLRLSMAQNKLSFSSTPSPFSKCIASPRTQLSPTKEAHPLPAGLCFTPSSPLQSPASHLHIQILSSRSQLLLLIPFPPLFPLLSYHALPQLCPALDWVIFTSVSHTIKGALKGRAMSASALGSRYRGNECRSD